MKKAFVIMVTAAMMLTFSVPVLAAETPVSSGSASSSTSEINTEANQNVQNENQSGEGKNANSTEPSSEKSASDAESNVSSVNIDAEHFPDKEFRNYVSKSFDVNQDGSLSKEEIDHATEINMKGDNDLQSLAGLEYLKHIVRIDCSVRTEIPDTDSDDIMHVYGGRVSTLDVSHNPDLEELYCSGNNEISSLDLTNNPKLRVVDCSNISGISSVDVSNCPDLEILRYGSTGISSIDVSSNPKLKELNVSSTAVDNIDVSGNPKLEILNVSGCYNPDTYERTINQVDVSKNPLLKQLDVSMTNISSIDVSNNPELTILYVFANNIENLDISNNDKLVRLDLNNTDISSVDVSDKPDLFALNVEMTRVSQLNVTHNPKLYEVYMTGDSGITSIDLSKNPDLEHLRVSGTSITDLDLSHNKKLAALFNYDHNEDDIRNWDSINVKAAPIKKLDLSNNRKLYEVYLDGSPIESIDVSKASNLRHLHLDGCEKVKYVDVTHNPRLVSLTIPNTGVTSLDLSKNLNLHTLDISNTNISKMKHLDFTGYTKILSLECENAGVESLKFDPAASVQKVNCKSNAIAELDLKGRQNPQWGYFEFDGSEQNATAYLPESEIKSKKIYLKDVVSDPSRVTVKKGNGYTYNSNDQSVTFDSDQDQAFDYTYSTNFESKKDDSLQVHLTIKKKYYADEADGTSTYGDDVILKAEGNADEITSVFLDDKVLRTDEYEVKQLDNGKVSVQLHINKISGLEDGNHTVNIDYKDGRATTSFTKKTHHYVVTKPRKSNNKSLHALIVKTKTLKYTGKFICPDIIVLDTKSDVVDPENYTIQCSAKAIGCYTFTVTGKNNYEGTLKGEFKVLPMNIQDFRLKAGKKSIHVIWSKSKVKLSGYQVQHSVKKSFKSGIKTKVFTKEQKDHLLKSLESNKKYYVRVRSYKTVKCGNKSIKLFSKWTPVKSVRLK